MNKNECQKTLVVNKYKEKYDIYCGRGSIFGNPFVIGRDGTREECIAKYKEWFEFLLRDPIFKRELLKLRGKRIACFCKPQACHLDIIVNHLNSL